MFSYINDDQEAMLHRCDICLETDKSTALLKWHDQNK